VGDDPVVVRLAGNVQGVPGRAGAQQVDELIDVEVVVRTGLPGAVRCGVATPALTSA
jgi:hypothetical protein